MLLLLIKDLRWDVTGIHTNVDSEEEDKLLQWFMAAYTFNLRQWLTCFLVIVPVPFPSRSAGQESFAVP